MAATVTVLLAAGGTALATATPAVSATDAGAAFNATSARQLTALQQIKTSESAAERKVDSRLVIAARQQHGSAATAALPRLQLGVDVSSKGTTTVDVVVTSVTTGLISRLKSVGADVSAVWKAYDTVRVSVPLSKVTTIAGWSDVRHVAPPVGSRTQGEPSTSTSAPPTRSARLASALVSATGGSSVPPAFDQGAVVSEGDATDAADLARHRFRVSGVGTKVCVLSNGVDTLSTSQGAGELPAVDVLPGQEGSGDEGTAMLEIVHDLAPGAQLGFATADPTAAAFAQNIEDLRFVAGCDVIVDDVIYYSEDPFQDGPIAQAVNAVTADGGMYFSSAGNEGNLRDGTSGTVEGDFVDSGQHVGKFAGTAHDFDPGPGVQIYDPLSENSQGTVVTLFWADPLGAAADDYDLYVFDSAGNVVALSQDVQDGNDDAFEILQIPFGTGFKLAVVKFSGAAQYLSVTTFGGRFSANNGLQPFATDGAVRGHSAAPDAVAVAAAPAAEPLPFQLEPGDPPNPSGPFPQPYSSTQEPEPFTSDGPRRVFFYADGTPITPGDTSSTGGTVRPVPAITAADGVATSVPGFDPFFGTSAAAPHAAAVAALILSGNPGASPAVVEGAMTSTAIDLAPAGTDVTTGAGALRADKALKLTGATPQPFLVVDQPTVTPTTGDGDAYLEPGEAGALEVQVTNIGDGKALAVKVAVSTSDPGVTITPAARNYGKIPVGGHFARTFTVTLAPDYPNGKPVALSVTVTRKGSTASPTTEETLPTGRPSSSPTTFAYTGPVVPIPDADAAGASVQLPVSGMGYVHSISFSIDGATCTTAVGATTVGIDHTFVGDLAGSLTAPDGTTAQLFSHAGAGGNNLCQVVFDDAAADPFSTVTSAQAPFTGSYRPINPLGALTAGSADGNWTFTVADGASIDTGNIRAFSLHLTGTDPPDAP